MTISENRNRAPAGNRRLSLNLYLRLFGRRGSQRRVWTDFVVLGISLIAPAILAILLGPEIIGGLYVGVNEHAIIEVFCGLVALMIAGMVMTIAIRQKRPAAHWFAAAFFVMGAFDLAHAVTNPHTHTEAFILYHTLSSVVGGLLLFVAANQYVRDESPADWSFRKNVESFMLAVCFVVIAGMGWNLFVPRVAQNDAGILAFSPVVYALHKAIAIIYTTTAIFFYRHFARRGGIALLLAFLLVLFAESAYLFSFSTLWDFHWWMWHGIKVTFYIGTLVSVFAGFSTVLGIAERSRRVLVRSNERLRKTQQLLQTINEELYERNAMANDAMRSLTFANALEAVAGALDKRSAIACWKLELKAEPGSEDEFLRRLQRASLHVCLGVEVPSITSGWKMPNLADETTTVVNVAVPLLATGKRIGHLDLAVRDTSQVIYELGRLPSLVAEIGPIINNALLHDSLIDASQFRAALLKVSAILASPRSIAQGLDSVCQLASQLLECDGALVWLSEEVQGTPKGQCWCSSGPETQSAECGDLKQLITSNQFLSSLSPYALNDRRPLTYYAAALEQAPPVPSPLVKGIGAVALFPIVNDAKLSGMMVFVRIEETRFSPETLAKGELLSGQVRTAISTALSFNQLEAVNIQLRQVEEIRARNDRLALLGQMAASVAHEVRNPLSAISNCLAVLRAESQIRQSGLSALEIIDKEVQRLNKLTSDFLEFGRPRPIERKSVLVSDVVGKVHAAVERHVAQEGLNVLVSVMIRGDRGPVVFDRNGFETVLWNLILNALQAIREMGTVDVFLRQGNRRLFLAVVDNGKGIELDELPRIFEPFYSRRAHGVGLGLAIVVRLIHEWQGKIRVKSKPGTGTAFFVTVPIAPTFTGIRPTTQFVEAA